MNIKNNFGIGVDIENIKRFEEPGIINNKVFLNKIFTKRELSYCFSKKNPSPNLTARFAAKEAIIKAFHNLNKEPPIINKIEIINNEKGVPIVNIKNYDVRISLSHCEDKALAFAVVTDIS